MVDLSDSHPCGFFERHRQCDNPSPKQSTQMRPFLGEFIWFYNIVKIQMKTTNKFTNSNKECLSQSILSYLSDKSIRDKNSKLYLITLTFNPTTFKGRGWQEVVGEGRRSKIASHSYRMFADFRHWWIGGIFQYLSNGTRRSKRDTQPICYAFVDDTRDDFEAYPHIHAVCWVRGDLVDPFENWLLGKNPEYYRLSKAERTWKELGADELHVKAIGSSHSDLRKAVFYASKFHDRCTDQEAGEELMRSFPEKHSPHPNRNRTADLTLKSCQVLGPKGTNPSPSRRAPASPNLSRHTAAKEVTDLQHLRTKLAFDGTTTKD